MHINRQNIISLFEQIGADQLHHPQQAINPRRQQLAHRPLSSVVERRNYQNGILQLERRAYRRKKDGGLTTRGPYWYFHYRERGQQKTFYLGKTDDPEGKLDEKLGKE